MTVGSWRTAAALCLVVAIAGSALEAQSPSLPEGIDEGWLIEPGDSMPEAELVDVDGVAHRLREFAGQPVVVVFWGTW